MLLRILLAKDRLNSLEVSRTVKILWFSYYFPNV